MRRLTGSSSSSLALAAIVVLPIALSACNRTDETSDAGNQADPAARAALEDPIMVDPDLEGQSNRNAATTGSAPASGGVPLSRQKAVAEQAQKDATKAAGGKLMSAPAATAMADGECETCNADEPATLGAIAASNGGKCDATLSYGADWANRMPPAFAVYPRATLREAAGVTSSQCNVRIVNFQTGAPLSAVIDYYYTRARRAGYNAEHTAKGKEHYLGGTRKSDGAAYVVIVNDSDGLRDVDIVASNGS
ncbi:MAG: hypothetical protein GW859_03755 [Sphingomonadales bacterium]|nr:hypothetical protein [Sphingomonadales bacterium]